MSLESMWEALEKYQPRADQLGFGVTWKSMTTERTEASAWKAAAAASKKLFKKQKKQEASMAAAYAAAAAADSSFAIRYITRAIEQESKETA